MHCNCNDRICQNIAYSNHFFIRVDLTLFSLVVLEKEEHSACLGRLLKYPPIEDLKPIVDLAFKVRGTNFSLSRFFWINILLLRYYLQTIKYRFGSCDSFCCKRLTRSCEVNTLSKLEFYHNRIPYKVNCNQSACYSLIDHNCCS